MGDSMLPDRSVFIVIPLFLVTVWALNKLLFKPLFQVLQERQRNTKGTLEESNKTLQHYTDLFNRYQQSIRETRLAGYKSQEQVRAEALRERAGIIGAAKTEAEKVILEAKDKINADVQRAKASISKDAKEMAETILDLVLQRQRGPIGKGVKIP